MVHAGTDAGLADDVPESFGQHAAQIVQAVVCAGGVHELQRFEAGGDRERISRQRTRLIHPAKRSQDVHDGRLPADRGQRQSPADDLAQAGQIRIDVEHFLSAARGQPAPRHHFVEDKHHAELSSQFAQGVEKSRVGQHHTHVAGHRFHDHRGDRLRVGLQIRAHTGRVVVFGDQRLAGVCLGHAEAVGQAQGKRARAGSDEQAVAMSVVATGEFDDFRPAGVSACEAQCGHRRFGARRSQPHLFNGRSRLDEHPRQFDLAAGRCPEARPMRNDFAESLDDRGRSVSCDEWAPRTDVVNVLTSVRIDDSAAGPPLNERRFPTDGSPRPHRTVHTARNVALRFSEERL